MFLRFLEEHAKFGYRTLLITRALGNFKIQQPEDGVGAFVGAGVRGGGHVARRCIRMQVRHYEPTWYWYWYKFRCTTYVVLG
jgi:hypothetical protein